MNRLQLALVVLAVSTCGAPHPSEADASVGLPDSGGGGGGGDGGLADAGAPPIVAAADQWTWVDFPDSKCASGTPTGIGVDPHPGSTELMIYFEGGGACSNALGCWGPLPTANNLAGYDASTFATARQRAYPVLDRTLANNPFKAMNLAYVPYCTGDLHAGTREVDLMVGGVPKPTYFWGATDLELFLARLVPTFPNLTRVVLVGTSAGGFATMLSFDRVARAFHTRVDLIDDSGPALTSKNATDNLASYAAWGFEPPVGCLPCSKHRDVLAFDRQRQPTSRYGFLSFEQDSTIAPFFGYSLAEFPAVLTAFTSSLAADPNAKTLIVSNKASHVVETDPVLVPDYFPWMAQLLGDDPAWNDVTVVHP